MSEIKEFHTCEFKLKSNQYDMPGEHTATFTYPISIVSRARIKLNDRIEDKIMDVNLQQVRDLHTFFAQLEEEMVRRMPVVETVPVQDDEVPF